MKLPIHTKSPGFGVKRGEYISPGINLFELCIGIIAMQRDDSTRRRWMDQLDQCVYATHVCRRSLNFSRDLDGRGRIGKIVTSQRKRSRVGQGRRERERGERRAECSSVCSLRSTSTVAPFDRVQFTVKLMHRHAADISKQEIYSGTCGCCENARYFVLLLIQRPLGIHALAYMNRSERGKTRFRCDAREQGFHGSVSALCNLYAAARETRISADNRY